MPRECCEACGQELPLPPCPVCGTEDERARHETRTYPWRRTTFRRLLGGLDAAVPPSTVSRRYMRWPPGKHARLKEVRDTSGRVLMRDAVVISVSVSDAWGGPREIDAVFACGACIDAGRKLA